MDWDLDPGDTIVRRELHDRFGGGRQGGMSPSRKSDNLFLFTDPASGEQHGYYDGWASDGVFEYTGQGQQGDQQMTDGNKALRDHQSDGRVVRLFTGTGGTVTYEGVFTLDPEVPYEERKAHATGGGPERRVYVFRLVPSSSPTYPSEMVSGVAAVPIAHQNAETWTTTPGSTTKASAVEARLVRRYQKHLEANGDLVLRHRYPSADGFLFNDVFNESRGQLVEAKGSSRRPDVRMALGQLLDYQALEPDSPALGMLLPEMPAADIVDLLTSLSVTVICPQGRGFIDTGDGSFV